jgi:hypothetical protein
MKNLKLNLSGAVALNKEEQRQITGGAVDCYDRYQSCDNMATTFGKRRNASYEEEFDMFADCMVIGGCG